MRVAIDSLAYGGAGVAHAGDGRIVFVEGGCPGDTLEVSIAEEHPRFIRATIAEVLEASPDRVTPPCPYFGVCGGCQWQHVNYGVQLESKRVAIQDALMRIGRQAGVEVSDVTASPEQYGYRNKVELSVARTPRGPALGFARHGSNEIVAIDACLLLPKNLRKAPRSLSGALRYLSSRIPTPVERVSVRVSRKGEVEVDLWTAPGGFPRQLAAKVIGDAVGARTITRVITKGEAEARKVSRVEVLSGPGAWKENLGGFEYLVSAPSFFQVNTRAAELLQSAVLGAVGADGTSLVADLYAGVGTFTLPLAAASCEVVAVESSSHALADLRRNLDAAGLEADIMPGDAGRIAEEIEGVDTVVVDPPRAGLSERAGRALVEARPRTIVYVSCDPATLARDVRSFTDAGYRLSSVTGFDLFPQTYHVETVATLTLSD
ncbi:MAG: 23S rRNA (uracil(1939)-C(5))-methyltransferase RlmD [Actinobacteria bacterium]|nr:MAG: 23S rRNA (uracil(1939)-C(5))-methyltransferase RlmD [Actinomycetota bacterium]